MLLKFAITKGVGVLRYFRFIKDCGIEVRITPIMKKNVNAMRMIVLFSLRIRVGIRKINNAIVNR